MRPQEILTVLEQKGRAECFTAPADEASTRGTLTITPRLDAVPDGEVLTVGVRAAAPLRLRRLAVRFDLKPLGVERMLANGFQSWSQTRELGPHGRTTPVWRPLRFLIDTCGEGTWLPVTGKVGQLRSWTYSYFRAADSLLLVGSLDEGFGYTRLEYDFASGSLWVEKEVDGIEITGDAEALRLFVGAGPERELWDAYTARLPRPARPAGRLTGWTSWYNYFTGITEEIIATNARALAEAAVPLDVFQIDDGYQRALGDWLETNDKFPSGMKALAGVIRDAGFRPGLWLAPFVCERDSRVYQEHPEWLLRDEQGRPVRAGYNTNWTGWFYSLDLYAPGLQDHLRRVFATVRDEWGYDLLKLDFLYAVAMQPSRTRSRGRIMSEAMELLREWAGDAWILGCGVPLGPAFGRVELCRIGSDVTPFWEHRPLAALRVRERLSTYNSLTSTLGRWQLNGRVFRNDPDVFILRDHKNRLTPDQRRTLLLVNYLLGDVLFFSDNVNEYGAEPLAELRSMHPLVAPEVSAVTRKGGLYRIRFALGERRYEAHVNMTSRAARVTAARSCFAPETGLLEGSRGFALRPFQSVCLREVQPSANGPVLLGTSGHLIPGAQVERLEPDGGSVRVVWHEHAAPGSVAFVAVPAGSGEPAPAADTAAAGPAGGPRIRVVEVPLAPAERT